jgi:hypothetical protein
MSQQTEAEKKVELAVMALRHATDSQIENMMMLVTLFAMAQEDDYDQNTIA